MIKTNHFTLFLCLSSLLILPAFATAQTNFTNGSTDGTWETVANWDNGLPSAGPQNANIGNGFTVSLSTNQSSNELDLVGDQNTGTAVLNHTAGALTGGGWMKVGAQSGTNGTYNLSGGASSTGWADVKIGRGAPDAVGNLNISGATTNFGANGTIDFGENTGVGNLQMTAGTMSAGGAIRFGGASTGTISGGTVTASGGEISVNTTSVLDIGNATLIGNEMVLRENAIVNQTSGSVTANNWVSIGSNGGSDSTYNLSGGSLSNSSDWFTVGEDGAGTLNVSGSGSASATANGMIIGRNDNAGSVGVLDIVGSSASVTVSDLFVDNATQAQATINWTADAGGVTAIGASNTTTFGSEAFLNLDLSADANSLIGGTEYLLIDNAAAVSGTFTGLAEGATVNFVSGTGTISYVGGTDGFDVVVTVASAAIPEPSSIGLLGLTVLGLASRRRLRS